MKWSYLENSLPLRAFYNITIQGHFHITTCDDLKRMVVVVSRDKKKFKAYSKIFMTHTFSWLNFKWRLIKGGEILSLQKYQCKHTERSIINFLSFQFLMALLNRNIASKELWGYKKRGISMSNFDKWQQEKNESIWGEKRRWSMITWQNINFPDIEYSACLHISLEYTFFKWHGWERMDGLCAYYGWMHALVVIMGLKMAFKYSEEFP